MDKKDSSSIEKHQFKPIGRFHKEKLRGNYKTRIEWNGMEPIRAHVDLKMCLSLQKPGVLSARKI